MNGEWGMKKMMEIEVKIWLIPFLRFFDKWSIFFHIPPNCKVGSWGLLSPQNQSLTFPFGQSINSNFEYNTETCIPPPSLDFVIWMGRQGGSSVVWGICGFPGTASWHHLSHSWWYALYVALRSAALVDIHRFKQLIHAYKVPPLLARPRSRHLQPPGGQPGAGASQEGSTTRASLDWPSHGFSGRESSLTKQLTKSWRK